MGSFFMSQRLPSRAASRLLTAWVLAGLSATAGAAAPNEVKPVELRVLQAHGSHTQAQVQKTVLGAEQSLPAVPTRFDGDVRDLPRARGWMPGEAIKEIPKGRPGADQIPSQPLEPRPNGLDPLVSLQYATPAAPASRAFDTPLLNFAGGGFTGVNPPDTVGVAGPNYYIQAINGSGGTEVRIYDKDSGTEEASFILESLGSNQCASGLGDPILLFDNLANRWLLSEFSSAGNRMCVYISQTDDPVAGGWFAYNFQAPSFPDYPKYGVWPNAYYVGTNENTLGLYAFDRANMLAGNPATFVRMSTTDLAGFGFQMLQPADFNGSTPPPPGAPGIFMRHRDTEAHGPAGFPTEDFLEIFFLQPDFATPANSVLTGPISVPIAEIDSDLCGLTSFNCFPQPGTSVTLDPLREVVMWRLQYRNVGTHETLVGNLVTDVNGANRGGIRWFELRRSGGLAGSWTLHQEGTYSLPGDNLNRFMGSIAMDGSGNIALGFGANSGTASNFPSIRYTGRLAGDALGAMTQGETVLVQGTASNSSNRWGDYSSLNVDPVDDCTFWYTHEYNTSPQWSTRIGKFKFDECGFGFSLTPTPAAVSVCAATDPDPQFSIEVAAVGGWVGSVDLSASGLPPGTSAAFSVDNAPVDFTSVLTIQDVDLSSSGSYAITVNGLGDDVDATQRSTQVTLDLAIAAPDVPTLLAPADGAIDQAVVPTLSWNAANEAAEYVVEVATDAGFTTIVYSATVAGTSHAVASPLAGGTEHFWRVRAANGCGDSANSAVRSFTTIEQFCAFPALAIPDNTPAGVNSDLVIGASLTLDDLNVDAIIDHTWVGDLTVTLTHVDTGTSAIIIQRPGNPATTFGCSGDDIDVTLDDAAASPVETQCAAGTPTINGTFSPNNPLAVFNGESFTGTWRLNVSDAVGSDTGTLQAWCLVPTLAAPTFLAVDDAYATPQDAALNVAAPGVLENDFGTGLTVSQTLVDVSNGTLTLDADGSFDYAPDPGYCGPDAFEYEMTDGVDTDTAIVDIDVECPNTPPSVGDQSFTVDENSANATVVGSIAATDPDVGDTLAFSVTGGSGQGVFAVGAGTGQITVANAAALDFETTASFTLNVNVSDGEDSDSAVITIDLNDVNDAPVVANQGFGLAENSAVATVVGTVAASDQDAGDVLGFGIVGGSGQAAFAIGAATGQITVADSAALDFETLPNPTLLVEVSDGTDSAQATITITLNDVNEAPAVANQGFAVDENSANGTVVGSIVAIDPDAGDTVAFSVTGGSGQTAFAVNAVSGEITVADAGQLDFESSASLVLDVQVFDGEFSDTATVQIDLNDVNEAPTAGALADQSGAEGIAFGFDASVGFADPDGDALAFSAVGLPASLSIDPATGEISGVPALGEAGTYAVLVTAGDAEFSVDAGFELTISAATEGIFGDGFED